MYYLASHQMQLQDRRPEPYLFTQFHSLLDYIEINTSITTKVLMFSEFNIHYTRRPIWPPSGNIQYKQNFGDDIRNMKFCKNKPDLVIHKG
jgi:hypothetical protein